jgi:hypothetical protein
VCFSTSGSFHRLDAPLASHPIWLRIWAIASLRPFDAVVGVVLLTLLIKGDTLFAYHASAFFLKVTACW